MIKKLAQQMIRIREVEKTLLELFSKGELQGTTHTYIGMEATAVGIISNLNPKMDYVISNHRNHGHYLAFGGELKPFFAELLGREGALCNGYGGSQHIEWKNFFSFGILGGTAPIACGMALAIKLKNDKPSIIALFLGDGAFGEGVVYEALNIAALWELPLFIIVENNGIAQTTPIIKNMAGSIEDRIRAFGIETTVLNSSDVEIIYDAAQKIIEEIRLKRLCRCLIINNHRLGPHSKGDDTRSVKEMREAKNDDPLTRIEQKLGKENFMRIQKKEKNEVNQILCEVMKSSAIEDLN